MRESPASREIREYRESIGYSPPPPEPESILQKTCSKCGLIQHSNNFRNNSKTCKKCRKQYAYEKASTIEARYNRLQDRAYNSELLLYITLNEYKNIVSKPCHYCNTKLEGCGFTLDRIDNSLGYIIENVLPCCGTCNKIRNNALTVNEMEVAMSAVILYRKTTII